MATRKKTAKPDFENALQQLERLVEEMESGELTLEQSMQRFEQGIKLTRTCQKTLAGAEQKIRMLIQENGGEALQEFDNE